MSEARDSLLPDLGVTATVVFDEHDSGPRTVDDQVKNDWPDFGIGYLDDVPIVSIWTFHVALYALQNPTPENVEQALKLIGMSGDVTEWLDEETLRARPVPKPDGWDRL